MIDPATFMLFLAAAAVLAATPGPGILFVAARTLAGGRGVGFTTSLGLGLGGMVHVIAAAVGVSAIVVASAEAFTLLKIAGALYLVWIGIKTVIEARKGLHAETGLTPPRRSFREGFLVEALNPKTGVFFLAFIPQFVDPSANVAGQFAIFGAVTVALNTTADLLVVAFAARARNLTTEKPRFIRRLREGSGVIMCGLGISLLFVRRTP